MKISSASLLAVSSLVAVMPTTGQRQQRLVPASGAKGGVRGLQAFADETDAPMSIAGETIAPMSIAGVAIEGKAHKSKSSKSKSQKFEIGEWTTYGDLPWFITSTFCGPEAPSDTCIHAGDIKDPTNDLVGDLDVGILGKKKKKMTENSDGIEAITDGQYTTLENTFYFPEDGILTFDMFCESERWLYVGYDYCSVFIDDERVIHESGGGWFGGSGWSIRRFPVSKGPATFKWKYEKDQYTSHFQDTMKLANIMFIPNDIFDSIPTVNITDSTEIKN